MEIIRTYAPTEAEYKALTKAALLLTITSETGTTYRVEETYFDYGQDWKWTTIVAHSPKYGSYQALTPRRFEDILKSTDLLATLANMKKDKFWLDKKED